MAEVNNVVPPVSTSLVFASTTTRTPPLNGSIHVRAYSKGNRALNTEVSLEVHLEKMRLAEALAARDHAVHCMENICSSLRKKESTIARLQQEKADLETKLAAYTPVSAPNSNTDETTEHVKELQRLGALNEELKAEVEALRRVQQLNAAGKENGHTTYPVIEDNAEYPVDILSPVSKQGVLAATEGAERPEKIIQARFDILAELPLPSGMPEDTLAPIIIPQPFTIHDFLGTAIGTLKSQLTNYRIFQECTTTWCPDREEHGYYLTACYKCSTNPRVSTAHRWTTVDLTARMDRPMECFFNKDGKWYYAGVYQSFRLPDITPQEWVQLPAETTQAIVKDTLAARKNTSPQNVYETGQLYACGALKAACIGLQCIGFDAKLYRSLLVQADACAKSGRWRGPSGGLGTGGAWNVNANSGVGLLSPSLLQQSHAVIESGYGAHA